MGRNGEIDLAEAWSLTFEDGAMLAAKRVSVRLGFSVQLMMYRRTGRFAPHAEALSAAAISYLAEQTGTKPSDLVDYDWLGRSGRRHRAEILDHLGLRRAARRDLRDATAWVGAELCPLGLSTADMEERLLVWFVGRQVVAPTEETLASLIAAARRTFEDHLLGVIAASLSMEHRQQLDAALADDGGVTSFSGLKADPGPPNLDNVLLMARRLSFVKELALPTSAMPDGGDPVIRILRRRVANETAWRMRQHPDGRRHALYALFLAHRERELTDGLVDLLIEVVHKVWQPGQETCGQGVHHGDRAGARQRGAVGQDSRGLLPSARGHRARCRVSGGWGRWRAGSDCARAQSVGWVRASGSQGAAGLIPAPLSTDAACGAGRAGIPLQQCGASSGAGCNRLATSYRECGAAIKVRPSTISGCSAK